MTPAQQQAQSETVRVLQSYVDGLQQAQSETVRVLEFYADAAERWLKKIDTSEGLCPCSLPLSKCQCPIRRQP